MVAIPARYVTMVKHASTVTGLPSAVIAAQINEESGFHGGCGERSSAGAVGIAQFLPSTFAGEGCKGSPCNDKDAFVCYGVFMYRLLKEEHGSVRDALAAYNAGPANKAAGYGYADSILAAAGQSPGLQVRPGVGPAPGSTGPGGGQPATLTSAGDDCLIGFSGIPGTSLWGDIFSGGGNIGKACFFTKSEARGIVGGLLIVGSAGMFMLGLVILAAYGLRATGGLGKAASIAAVVPGGQGLAAGLSAVQGRVTRTGAPASGLRPAGSERAARDRLEAAEREAPQGRHAAVE
jgi:Transglycosylase SLT domain